MTGESPGREQQQGASGKAAERSAADPRLVVFRAPTEGRRTRAAEGVPEEHAGAALGSVGAAPPESTDSPDSGARPHPAASSASGPVVNTPNDVSPVDEFFDVATPAAPPSPRSPEALPPEAEPNRDLPDPDSAADAAPGEDSGEDSDDAPEAESGAESGGGSGGGSGAEAESQDPEPESPDTETDDTEPDAAPEEAPEEAPASAEERDEHTKTLRIGGRSGAAAGGRTAGDAAGADDADDAADAAGPDDADDVADAAPGSGTSDAEPAEPVEDARPENASSDQDQDQEQEQEQDPEDATGPAGSDSDAADADEVADAAPSSGNAAPEDVRPADSGRSSGARSASVLRPLVSDLPGERPAPQGSEGASGARSAPSRASAPYEPTLVPAAPYDPRTGPVEPSASPAAGPIGQQAAPAKPAARAPLPPYAGKASAIGTPTAATTATPDGAAAGPDGTRAMPVPPEPEAPLKLLAELTNTPPPRQTLLRTIGRRFKIWTPLVLLLVIVFVVAQALRPLPSPSLALTAAPSYTFDGTPLPQTMPWPTEGQAVAEVEGLGSLGVHGAQTPVPIASVTKVMTAYLILRDHPLTGKQTGPVITVDAQAADEAGSSDESTAQVREGQRFTERQMLQLLLIPSGNNIARLLARWDSGTQEVFVTKMMKAATDLGMTNTTYTGASGFESTTKSTAVDQLKLAREIMKNDVFRSVVAQPNIKIPGVGTIYNNNNDLVNVGVIGVKTGSSTPAGGALMWAANKKIGGKEQLILGVVLQQHGGTTVYDSLQAALVNSQKLINSVQGGLTSSTIVKKGEVVGHIDDGLGGHTPVVAGKDLTAVGWAGLKTTLTLTPAKDGLPHSAKAGTQVGTLGFGSGSARTTVPVVLQADLGEPSFTKKLIRLG